MRAADAITVDAAYRPAKLDAIMQRRPGLPCVALAMFFIRAAA